MDNSKLKDLIGLNESEIRELAKTFHDLMFEAIEALNESGTMRRAWAKGMRYSFQELRDEGFGDEQAMAILLATIGQLKSPQLRK